MARELPVIHPGNVITYSLGNCHYTSVVIEISGFDADGYIQIIVYDLLTPDINDFPPATIDNPVEISLNPIITDITVHSYDSYLQEHPELFL